MSTSSERKADNPSYLGATIQMPDPDQAGAESTNIIKPIEGLSDEDFAKLSDSILVIVPHRRGEGIHPGICAHFGMWGRIGLRIGLIADPFGGFIEVTRGGIVKMFLEFAEKFPQIKYLVMIDNDESIDWDAPLRLAYHGLPVVSGVVCGYHDKRGIFACFTAKDENGMPRFPTWRETEALPAEGVIEAHQVGTGLLCVRRDVLETIRDAGKEPFFIPEESRLESVKEGNLKKSEDIVFSELCEEFGFKRYVDLAIHAKHYKNIPVTWPADSVRHDIKAIAWRPSKFDYKGVP